MKNVLTIMLLTLLSFGCSAKSNNNIVLSKDNTLVLLDEVNDETVAKLSAQALVLNDNLDSDEPIYLILNTPGGSVTAGLELIDNLKSLGRPVHTITIFAASMGFQIAQNLNERLMLESGTLMSHRARTSGVGGEFGGQEPSQLSNRLNLWSRKIRTMDEQTVKRTKGKQTIESYTKAYENELWLSGKEAITDGYADKIVTAQCDSSLKGTNTQNFSFFGLKIEVVFSNCPLITGPLDVRLFIKTKRGLIPLNEYLDKGGMLGTACMVQQNSSIYECPVDTSLTMEKLEETKQQTLKKLSQEYIRSKVKSF